MLYAFWLCIICYHVFFLFYTSEKYSTSVCIIVYNCSVPVIKVEKVYYYKVIKLQNRVSFEVAGLFS